MRLVIPGGSKATGLLGAPVWAYGHSYVGLDQQNEPGWRQVQQAAVRLGSTLTNYAVGGDKMAEQLVVATNTWDDESVSLRSERIVILDCMANTLRTTNTAQGKLDYAADVEAFLSLVDDALAVVCIEQGYLQDADYTWWNDNFSTGADNSTIDEWNGILAGVVADHDNATVAELNAAGWDRDDMLVVRHPNDVGMVFTAWQIDTALADLD